jgi:hypothetical protein
MCGRFASRAIVDNDGETMHLFGKKIKCMRIAYMPRPVLVSSGGGSGNGGMIAVAVLFCCILLSICAAIAGYVFWDDIFAPAPSPGAVPTPSPGYESPPYGTPSSSPSPYGSPSSPPSPYGTTTAPGGLVLLETNMANFTLRRRIDKQRLYEGGKWNVRTVPDGSTGDNSWWNYHHQGGKTGGFIYSGHEGGNIAWRINEGGTPSKATVSLNRRNGSTDPGTFFFRLLTKPQWTETADDGQKLQYYVIKMHDNNEYCMTFAKDNAEQGIFEKCVGEESSDDFKRQTFVLRVNE